MRAEGGSIEDSLLERVADKIGRRLEAEFVEYAASIRADRFFADAHRLGRFL